MNRIIILLLTTTLFCACQKKDDTEPDASKVTFNITSPTAGQIFHNGDSVKVHATVTFPAEMHGYEIKITDTLTGNVIYDNAQHLHNDHFDIADGYIATGTAAQPALRLELIAEIDHTGTLAKKTVAFQYVP